MAMNRRQLQALHIAAHEHEQLLTLLSVMEEASADDPTMGVLVRRCREHVETAHKKFSLVVLEESAQRG